MKFIAFPKIPRLNREIVVTEKIDGTNAQIVIDDVTVLDEEYVLFEKDGLGIVAGSRSRFLTRKTDNFGFAKWVQENAEELLGLGVGQHFGEWWGQGIQRGYGLDCKKFSLFNTGRWYDSLNHKKLCPDCCDVVPILYMAEFSQMQIEGAIETLRENGSRAAPGFDNPEGVVVFHTASREMFKVTCKDDNKPKTWVETNGVKTA